LSDEFVCQECGQELESAKTKHTYEDCEKFKVRKGGE
jgi:transcription initiation factor IIE alpha subunit